MFAVDATTGKPLRYRILVRDMQIQRVLYNMGGSCLELMFQEHRVDEGNLVMITNEMISPPNARLFAQIVGVPVKMLAPPPVAE